MALGSPLTVTGQPRHWPDGVAPCSLLIPRWEPSQHDKHSCRMTSIQKHHMTQDERPGGPTMQRITITVDDELVAALDRVIAGSGYQNRSEAIRDLARAGIAQLQEQSDSPQSGVAALVYVYDHQERELAKRLTRSFHEHHDLSVATMHVHLD